MEIDVQLSADGIPVLMHDLTVDRTTNLSGRVSGFTAAQLAAADAGAGELHVVAVGGDRKDVDGHGRERKKGKGKGKRRRAKGEGRKAKGEGDLR